jgi:hypothetical protein
MYPMTKFGAAALLASACLLPATSEAASVKAYTDACSGGQKGCTSFVIQGEIALGDEAKFESEVKRVWGETQSAVVILDSDGGDIVPAMAIGRSIRKLGIGTHVQFKCISACAMIWVAGKNISALGTARVGFHAVYRKEGNNVREFGAGNALVGAYYAELGFNSEAIYAMTSTAPQSMMWLKTSQATKLGINLTLLEETKPAKAEITVTKRRKAIAEPSPSNAAQQASRRQPNRRTTPCVNFY